MKDKSIFVTGLLSVKVGGLEKANLGNFAIIDTFFDQLEIYFPKHKVRTSFQLTEEFETKKRITCLRNERFWTYGFYTAKHTIADFIKIIVYKLSTTFKKEGQKKILLKSKLLKEIFNADFVIDFSGDVFGENAKFNLFLEGAARIFYSLLLQKKVFIVASSPGPFYRKYRKLIFKYLYKRVEFIINREPKSTELLISEGIPANKIYSAACPSFLFKGYAPEKMKPLLTDYGINEKDNLVGFIITGWNMPKKPYYKHPREDWEIKNFIDYLIHLYNNYNFKLIIMSHGNSTDNNGNMIFGNDYYISKQIYDSIPNSCKDRITFIDRILDAKESKSLIGNFDMLISGRLHGAVAGLSQYIPTLVIDYGHEPKAHKLKGFLELLELESYLCQPNSLDQLVELTDNLWNSRNNMKLYLQNKIQQLQKRALLNFEIIKKQVG